jgi:hypothetical protein
VCAGRAPPHLPTSTNVLRPGTTPAPARRPQVRVLPRERWGVLRGPPMAMRTGVGLGTDGSRAASKSDETRVGSAEAAVKGSGGLRLERAESGDCVGSRTGASGGRHAAAVRAPSTRMAASALSFETFHSVVSSF